MSSHQIISGRFNAQTDDTNGIYSAHPSRLNDRRVIAEYDYAMELQRYHLCEWDGFMYAQATPRHFSVQFLFSLSLIFPNHPKDLKKRGESAKKGQSKKIERSSSLNAPEQPTPSTASTPPPPLAPPPSRHPLPSTAPPPARPSCA